MIKFIPILFSTAMVQAILEGRKTMTRRIVKYRPLIWLLENKGEIGDRTNMVHHKSPYGQTGDLLWVRESHFRYGFWTEKEGEFTKTGKQKWMFVSTDDEVRYFDNPPADYRKGMHNKDPHTVGWYKRSSLYMPKGASRLFLQVKGIQVERIQDITEDDAKAEGISKDCPTGNMNKFQIAPYKYCFADLWERINGIESWEANPWVWVIEFEKEGFLINTSNSKQTTW